MAGLALAIVFGILMGQDSSQAGEPTRVFAEVMQMSGSSIF